jgi:hypothetical protein
VPATYNTVVEAALNNDGQANLAVWAAPEATHALPATETMSVATHVQTFEFEMLEPNKEDVAMFSEVPMPVLNPTFDYILITSSTRVLHVKKKKRFAVELESLWGRC